MIEQLRLAGDQLRLAWDNYLRICSVLKDGSTQGSTALAYGPPAEVLHHLDTELAFLSSHKPKIKEAEIAISRGRNYSPYRISIKSLPPEILSCIFHIVLAQPCNLHLISSHDGQYYSRYVDNLAQVCDSWRRIAISSPTLWCHIDLAPYEPCSDELVFRAENHLVRAGDLPIDLHIAVDDTWNFEYSELYRFVQLVSSRVGGLELTLDGPFRGFHRDLFGLLLRRHPNLTKLALRSEGHYSNNFLVPDSYELPDEEENIWPLVIDSTDEQMETSFVSLTVLHLRGIFPLWSSRAYHGLVDLRLLSTENLSHIREAELVSILNSSPGLEILHFGLEILESTPLIEQLTPVKLMDLQVVKIFPDSWGGAGLYPGSILRLLAPGTKPLRLSFESYYVHGTTVINELENFFSRSRVEEFCSRGVFPPMSLLLRYSSSLEQVSIDDYQAPTEEPSPWPDLDKLAPLPNLKSLHVTRSALSSQELLFLRKCCPDGLILDDSCSIDRDLSNGFPMFSTRARPVRWTEQASNRWETQTTDSDISY